jgi:transposase
LTAFLVAAGVEVFECERPRRRDRRRGKSDLIDARAAAKRLLAGERLPRPRGGGVRDELRLLLVQRQGAVAARTDALNQLHGITVTLPERLRDRLRGLRRERLAAAAVQLRARRGDSTIQIAVLHGIGRRALQLSREIAGVDERIEQITAELVPALRAECGVGPVCAAQLVVSSGDPNRMRSEASFAALAGTSPVEASSGLQQRHRLNRGGDRQLNRALHVITLHRVRWHPPTAAYYQRLLKDGKTPRGARRCVKRQLARYFHHKLKTTHTPALTQ